MALKADLELMWGQDRLWGFVGRGGPGGPGRGRMQKPTSLLKELRDLTMIRFNLCQNYFESFKYDSFPDLNTFIATTNHKDIIYIIGYICWIRKLTVILMNIIYSLL